MTFSLLATITAPARLPVPRMTHVGIQWRQTIRIQGGCDECPFLAGCRRDVFERDGLAWCESVSEGDLLEPEIEAEFTRGFARLMEAVA